MAKTAAPDIQRFKDNKSRVTDYFEHNADSIREKRTVMMTASAFTEMAWLAAEVRRLDGLPAVDDLPRFEKIERFVARVCDEQAQAVKSGQFVKVRADIFAAWRFLVRANEAVLHRRLELEECYALGGRLPEENADRIVLDLEDGLDDPEGEEAVPAKKPKGGGVKPPEKAAGAGAVSGLGTAGFDDGDLPGGDTVPILVAAKPGKKG